MEVIRSMGYPMSFRKAAVKMYEEFELSLGDVSEILGVSKSCAAKWMKEEGVVRPLSEARRVEMGHREGKNYELLEAAALGMYVIDKRSTQEIGDELGTSRTFVEAVLKRRGVYEGKASRISLGVRRAKGRDALVERAVELLEMGCSKEEIAKKMNRSIRSVHLYLRDGTRKRRRKKAVTVHVDPDSVGDIVSELDSLIERGADSRLLLRSAREVFNEIRG